MASEKQQSIEKFLLPKKRKIQNEEEQEEMNEDSPAEQSVRPKEDSVRLQEDATEVFKNHENTSYHGDCVLRANEFLKVQEGKTVAVVNQLDQQKREQIERNKKFLGTVVQVVQLCGQRNWALRGHSDSGPVLRTKEGSNTEDPGNFKALLQFLAKFVPELKSFLENVKLNAQYTSPQIQNEIIQLCGKFIQEKLIEEVHVAKFFSVLVDEATDQGRQEQMALLLRFVTTDEASKKFVIKEEFLQFLHLENTKGETIANSIFDCLQNSNLDLNFLVGQGYDGAANMAGKWQGVQARIKQLYPLAEYTHCAAHSLNLACSVACKLPQFMNTVVQIQEIIFYFTYCDRKTELLKTVVQQLPRASFEKKQKLINYCDTRWTDRHRSFIRFKEMLQAVVMALDEISTDMDNWLNKQRGIADSHLATIKRFEFIINLHILEKVSSQMKGISILLQKTNVDLMKCCALVKQVKNILTEYKTVDRHWDELYEEATNLAAAIDCTVRAPRASNLHPSEYFKQKNYIPFLQTMMDQLDLRFSTHQQKIFSLQGLIPEFISSVSWENLKESVSKYEAFLDGSLAEFKAEFERWKALWKDSSNPPATALDALDACDKDFYPLIFTVLQIFCTLPVTTASVERSFSAMRRIKTYLRTSMGDDRFTGLSLMSMHSKNVTVPPEQIVQRFANASKRRLPLNAK